MAIGNIIAASPSVVPAAPAPSMQTQSSAAGSQVASAVPVATANPSTPQALAMPSEATSAAASPGSDTTKATGAGTGNRGEASFGHALARATGTHKAVKGDQQASSSRVGDHADKSGKGKNAASVAGAIILPTDPGTINTTEKTSVTARPKTADSPPVSRQDPASSATSSVSALPATAAAQAAMPPVVIAAAVVTVPVVPLRGEAKASAPAAKGAKADVILSAAARLSAQLPSSISAQAGAATASPASATPAASFPGQAGGMPPTTADATARAAIHKLQAALGVAHHPDSTGSQAPASIETSKVAQSVNVGPASSRPASAALAAAASSSATIPLAVPQVSSNLLPGSAGTTQGMTPMDGGVVQASASSQISAALVGVGHIPGHGAAGQGSRLTIALAPPAIGTVTLQIDRNADGTSSVTIGATHAATLDQLQVDRTGLEQMLAQAGVPAAHRSITFNMIAVRSDAGAALQAGVSGGGAGGFAFAGGGQAGAQSGGAGGGNSGGSTPGYARPPSAGALVASVPSEVLPLAANVALRRFGVNVMA